MVLPSTYCVALLAGWLKVHCDASLAEDIAGVGIEFCVRDAAGSDLIRTSSIHKNISVFYPYGYKLLAIGKSVALAIDSGVSKIIVESYGKGAIDLILSPDPCLNEFDIVPGYILDFPKRAEIFFYFVPRNCNKVAYGFTLHALFLYLRRVGTLYFQIKL